MKKKYTKIAIFLIVCFLFFTSISFYVFQSGKKHIVKEISDLPETEVVIILGAKVYENGLSQILADRVDTAIEVYQLGKADKILVSGDHGSKSYDEVNAIKQYLLNKNIPSEDIFLDHAGFNTYNTMFRANYIFDVDSAIVITQNFHLPRALYLAKELDIEAHGFSSDKRKYAKQGYNSTREFLARFKAWLNITFNKSPKYLGEKISLEGDSQESWDIKIDSGNKVEIREIEDDFLKELVAGAILQTTKKVIYDPSYYKIDYPGGDVPENKGVCTDVVIRSYRHVGIDLQKKVHEDMRDNFKLYPDNWGLAGTDKNIDHRRVPNLQTFFKRFGKELKISADPNDYKPGHIVVWRLPNNMTHIGVVSNHYVNETPKIIHNIGSGPKLENMLFEYEIISHYLYQ